LRIAYLAFDAVGHGLVYTVVLAPVFNEIFALASQPLGVRTTDIVKALMYTISIFYPFIVNNKPLAD
jgi:hypothetical protein